MKTIFEKTIHKVEIEKSKFFGYIFHIEDVSELKTRLKEITKEYPKATHYCYAYSINKKLKNSDDGEPSGTAGNPIQEAIIQNNLDNICIVVIRYFGGIKLGAGGLTRAYLNTALETIRDAKISEIIATNTYDLIYEYTFNNAVQKYLKEQNIQILNSEYEVKVKITIATNNDINDLKNITNGNIEIVSKEQIDIIK